MRLAVTELLALDIVLVVVVDVPRVNLGLVNGTNGSGGVAGETPTGPTGNIVLVSRMEMFLNKWVVT